MDKVRADMYNLSLPARVRVGLAFWPYGIFVVPASVLGQRPVMAYSSCVLLAYVLRKRFPMLAAGLLGATLSPIIAARM